MPKATAEKVPPPPASRPRRKKKKRATKKKGAKVGRRTPPGPELLTEGLSKKGWTQAHLAAELNVTRPTVSRWISRERSPKKSHVVRLHELFDIPPSAWY